MPKHKDIHTQYCTDAGPVDRELRGGSSESKVMDTAAIDDLICLGPLYGNRWNSGRALLTVLVLRDSRRGRRLPINQQQNHRGTGEREGQEYCDQYGGWWCLQDSLVSVQSGSLGVGRGGWMLDAVWLTGEISKKATQAKEPFDDASDVK